MAVPSSVAAARWPGHLRPAETAACDEQHRERVARANAFEIHGHRSPRDACTSGQATPTRWLALITIIPSGGAIGVGHAAAAWQHAENWRTPPFLHLVGDSRSRCSPAARHGLEIRYELGSDAASGRIGHHPLHGPTVSERFLSFSAPFRSWLAPAPGKPVSTQFC